MAPPREVRRSKWIFSDLESTGACGGLLWFLRCFVTYHRDTSAIEQSNPSANRIDTMPTREARVSMWLSASTKRLIDENLHDEKHHVSDGADSEVERGKPRRFTAHGEHDLLEPHGEHQNRHHQIIETFDNDSALTSV
ncbi:hypothetical protein Bca101_000352 [Brassica carinata]